MHHKENDQCRTRNIEYRSVESLRSFFFLSTEGHFDIHVIDIRYWKFQPPSGRRLESTRFGGGDSAIYARNLSWFRNGIKRVKRFFKYVGLLGYIERLTHWMTKRPVQIYGPGWSNSLGIGSDNGYSYGWNTLSFNFPLNQSHGLVAQTSARCQQNSIDMILNQMVSHLRCMGFQ